MRRGSHVPSSAARGHAQIQPSAPPDADFIAAERASANAASPPTRSMQSSYARMTRGGANAAAVAASSMASRASLASGTSAPRHRRRDAASDDDIDASPSSPKPPLPPTPPPSSSSLSMHAMTPPSATATPMTSPDDAAGVARHRRPGRRWPGASSMPSRSAGAAIALPPPSAIDLSAELFDARAPYVHVLHIPNAKVGLVIGRDGRHVSFVQARTGTRISIARDSWDGAKRRVEIEGSPDACALATEMIERLIDTSEDRGTSEGLDVGGGFLERVAASARAAAKVIEDDIARYSGANGNGASRDDEDGMVFGEDFDGRATAGVGRAHEAPPTSASASPATATMTIPHTKVGMIIGRGGENIKFIQQSTHARVQIQTDAETPEGAPNRIVYLRGSIQACRDAAKMINDQCVGRVMIHGGPGVDVSSSPPPSLPAAKMGAVPVAPPSMYVDPTTYVSAMSAPYFGQPYTGLYNPPPVAEHHHAHAAAAHAAMMMHHHHHHPYAAYWNSYMEYCQRASGAAYGGVGTYGYDASDAPTYYDASGGGGGGAVEQPRLQQDTTTKTKNATSAPAVTEDQEDQEDANANADADNDEEASPKLT